jgi:positive regulator of sigma E activity
MGVELLNPELLTALSDLGAVTILLLILLGGAKGWWVFGWHYEEVAKERDAWREIALSTTSLAEKAIQRLERRAP